MHFLYLLIVLLGVTQEVSCSEKTLVPSTQSSARVLSEEEWPALSSKGATAPAAPRTLNASGVTVAAIVAKPAPRPPVTTVRIPGPNKPWTARRKNQTSKDPIPCAQEDNYSDDEK